MYILPYNKTPPKSGICYVTRYRRGAGYIWGAESGENGENTWYTWGEVYTWGRLTRRERAERTERTERTERNPTGAGYL